MECFGVSGSLRFLSILKGHNVNQEFQRGNRLSGGIDRLSPSPPLLFIAFFSSHRSPLSERLEQATWMANSREWGLLSCQINRDGDEKRGQMPLPPSTLQHFSLIAQSNSAVLNILICDSLFQVTSSFVIALGL